VHQDEFPGAGSASVSRNEMDVDSGPLARGEHTKLAPPYIFGWANRPTRRATISSRQTTWVAITPPSGKAYHTSDHA
jgi:hypothetical protein